MVGEDKASKKKNSMSSQLQADNLMAYPNQKNLKNMPSGFTYKIKEFACSSLKQVNYYKLVYFHVRNLLVGIVLPIIVTSTAVGILGR